MYSEGYVHFIHGISREKIILEKKKINTLKIVPFTIAIFVVFRVSAMEENDQANCQIRE